DVACIPMDIERTLDAIADRAEAIARAGAVGAFVGGDHTIALGTLRGLTRVHGPIGLIHFDAHTDTYGPAWDVDPHHGTIFRNAIEEELLREGEIIQVGLRGPFSMEEDLSYARKHGFEVVLVDEVKRDLDGVCRKLAAHAGRGKRYVSFDIDAIDPAYAPGTGTPVPGGLTSWEAQQLVRALRGVEIVGMDLVEVSPPSDHANITALLGAVLLAEMIAVHAATRVEGARNRPPRAEPHAAKVAKGMAAPSRQKKAKPRR
ncbi:MAG: arginase family protein, partial [Deltaproteobacteria bacterium]|nr:arginase family protein [Deltaproteobacteria bacterium]